MNCMRAVHQLMKTHAHDMKQRTDVARETEILAVLWEVAIAWKAVTF